MVNSNKPEQSALPPHSAARAVVKAEVVLHTSLAHALGRNLSAKASSRVVVAYSGGLDSHVLLCAAAVWVKQNPKASLRAIYIDHGLQAPSESWGLHCERVCEEMGVEYTSFKVQVPAGNDQSPEEAARDARYAALKRNLQAGEYLLTAHHADDQAETLLLQLMRGAGVRGLASMPESKTMGDGFHLRPLLGITRATLSALAQHWQLQWVEDPTNRENRYSRNLLRNTVMPLLQERWPATVESLSRSASHCAEAARLNRDLALIDLGQHGVEKELPIALLIKLPLVRRKNALRHWIEVNGFQLPSSAQLERIDKDLILAGADSSGHVGFGGAGIRRYQGLLYLAERDSFKAVEPFSYIWNDRQSALLITETGDTLTAEQLYLPWLKNDVPLMVRNRVGGERIRLSGHSQSHSVKSLLQQNGIPPWCRSRIPFLYVGDQLVGVIGIGFSGAPQREI